MAMLVLRYAASEFCVLLSPRSLLSPRHGAVAPRRQIHEAIRRRETLLFSVRLMRWSTRYAYRRRLMLARMRATMRHAADNERRTREALDDEYARWRRPGEW